ncbi:hypothetical protein MLD63_17780 [Paracoccus sp. TK19116]|uniref:Tetratricopeptide repeat protein n=1 Tax=Paracoccus albicereus TaxID=2922394 RepID=A0ABT1MVV9_9RHOB|nr:hypothetical protein [Paracoccus albicereus]MCQ0972264.1 hypothetical protein [Paracoccus albicereus]
MKRAKKLRTDGNFREAAAAYSEAAAMRPHSKAGLFVAMCQRDAGLTSDAIDSYRLYASRNPEDFDGWCGLGVLLKRLSRFDEAIYPMRRALSLRDDAPARNTLIASLWRVGKTQEAEREGLRNLQLKHQLAQQIFKSSSCKDFTIKPGGRGFDPEDRQRNIISFSLWGDRPEYITGAIVNAQIAQHLYVRWTPRFYCDGSVPADARDALKAYGAQVIMMTGKDDASIRPMWRFLAADDPDINVFVCRDADSRLNAKELLAVTDWLNSGRRFHIMRDHAYHHELILAGMWGGMAGILPNIRQWLRTSPKYFNNKFGDQAFLADMLWPLIFEDAKIHDSVYRFPNADRFPNGYDLPGLIHVGGGVKNMPHWSSYVQMSASG